MEKTFKEIPSNTPQNEIENLIKIYPTIENSIDGSKIWLSRLQKDDKRRKTEYEIANAYWIPENPLKALAWVILIGSFTQSEITEIKNLI